MYQSFKVSFAVTAAALFVAGCSKGGEAQEAASPTPEPAGAVPAAEPSADGVKCLGINECKGQGQCAVPNGHSCAGQNECKGKGWIKVGKAECDTKGGTVL